MNIAIVTGASSGMGREFVRQLGGYVSVDEIWAVARRASALETLKAEASVPVRPIVLDLLEESSFTELEALLESELFGYERGAFTGARSGGKSGFFEIAHGGTIFLDEIGELPLPMQVRLLRVLQDREIQRVGSNVREKVNVRVVAATNRNLYQMVKKGEFRSDLYYRLNVVTLHLPLLRERKEDLPLLIQMILSKISKKESLGAIEISREAMDHLLRYDWPGNVRELENVLERAINFTDAGEKIKAKNLPERITGSMVSQTVMPLKELMENTEKDAIKDALLRCRNCKAKAANELGISRTTLYEKMMKYEI